MKVFLQAVPGKGMTETVYANDSVSGFPADGLAPTGSSQELRQFIAQQMCCIGLSADNAINYTLLGDDGGLDYSLNCMASCLRAALTTFAELREKTGRRRIHGRSV